MNKQLTIANGADFAKFLERIHLNGLIQECVIAFDKDGLATCQAVDLSNAVCVSQSVLAGSDASVTIGVGNLSTLCKFFGSGGEFNASLTEDTMTVKRKNHGQVKFQLIAPSEIPTAIKNVDMAAQCKGKTKIVFKASKVDDLLGYFNLLGCESVVFSANNGKLQVQSSASDKEQFQLTLGDCKQDLSVVTYAKHLLTILKQAKSDVELLMYLQNDSALMIVQEEQYWLISPIEA